MSHKRVIRSGPFWRHKKIQDPSHKDYRPASEDLPLNPSLWRYNQEAYEIELALSRKNEKNISKLQTDLNPNQR